MLNGRIRTFPDLEMAIGATLRRRGRAPQMGLMGWIADSAGPLNFISPLLSCAGTLNLSRFCDRRIDAAAQDAARTRGAEAVDKWRALEEALAERSPTVPLANESWITLSAQHSATTNTTRSGARCWTRCGSDEGDMGQQRPELGLWAAV